MSLQLDQVVAVRSICSVAYDLVLSGFPYYWYPIWGCLAFGLSYLGYRLFLKVTPPKLQIASAPKTGFWGACVCITVISIYFPVRAYFEYQKLRSDLSSNNVKIVEGTIRDFKPYQTRVESFSVCGRTFSYDPAAIAPGYRSIRAMGGAIHNGAKVRVTYIGDIIVRVETCSELRAANCPISQ